MVHKTLIIKLDSMGDVLRTSPLLRILGGDVYWVTRNHNIPLLPSSSEFLTQPFLFDDAKHALANQYFDLVLSLDDDHEAASLATNLQTGKLIGSFIDKDNNVSYTESSRGWFDMGLCSHLTKEQANTLKQVNTQSHQDIHFGMIGKEFNKEEYVLNPDLVSDRLPRTITKVGIETRSGARWPTKRWNRYADLSDWLRKAGIRHMFFRDRSTLHQFVSDINSCSLVVTGDTLTLHIALALQIKVVALFTCTSPAEIYGYNRTRKIVSPLLHKAFYNTAYTPEAVDAISLDEVYEAIQTQIRG